ncbi:MAG: hypothetical protein CUN56_07660 [Phototrophicales bacterium]|nr:MAG: hypothetical protein CUN56_07660 [Phototrophicales bacterium]
MKSRTTQGILAVLGVLLVAGGLLLMQVIVPAMKVFPADVDTTRTFDVAYLTLLNADTLEFMEFSEGGDHDLRIERNIFVEEVDGNRTLIRETQTLFNGDTPLRPPIVKYHALDRHTMEPLDDVPEEWAARDGYWEREGLVIGWGIGAEERDYIGWNDDTRSTVEMEYQGKQERGGITTLYFTSEREPELISEEHAAVLGLPPSLTIAQLRGLADGMDVSSVDLSDGARAKLTPAIINALRNVEADLQAIPLVYYYDYYGEYWVEPTTGVLIDTHKYENRGAAFPPEIMDAIREVLENDPNNQDPEAEDYLPPDIMDQLMPITVNRFEYVASEQSVQDAVADATSNRDRLILFGQTIPVVLIVLGVLLAGLAGYFYAQTPVQKS